MQSDRRNSRPATTELARLLRRNQTDAERRLWPVLRAKRFAGTKFKRQAPIGNYVVDFCSFDRRLVIELDGGQHAERAEEDQTRTDFLHSQGFTVLRFWNNDVLENLEGVVFSIEQEIE